MGLRKFLCNMFFSETNVEREYRNAITKKNNLQSEYLVLGTPYAPYSRNNDLELIGALARTIKENRECD